MTPHKHNARGSFVLDRQFAGIGRIHRASGTSDLKLFRRVDDMLTDLRRRGRDDYLRAIRDGTLQAVDLYWRIQRRGWPALEELPTVAEIRPVQEIWEAWAAQIGRRNTRLMHNQSWRHLGPKLPPDAGLADLAPTLLALRDQMLDRAPSFNRARASVLAMLKTRVGTLARPYLEVQAVPRLYEDPATRQGLPLARALEIRDRLSEAFGRWWWGLCLTGMRPGEWLHREGARWAVVGDTVEIVGSKNKFSSRTIPLLWPELTLVARGARRFGDALSAVAPGVTPHVARYTFKSMCNDAGIPGTRSEQYMGHALKGISGLYSAVEIRDWLARDGATLRTYISDAEDQHCDRRRRKGLASA